MELIELSTTTQRALELLAANGNNEKTLYGYTHTGFGSILRHFHRKGILYVTAEMLDVFLYGACREPASGGAPAVSKGVSEASYPFPSFPVSWVQFTAPARCPARMPPM